MKFIRRKPSLSLMSIALMALMVLMLATVVYAAFVTPTGVETVYPQYGQSIRARASLRSATILTASYVSTDITQFRGYKSICLLFELEQGSLTSFQYKVWMSNDGVTWFLEATESVAVGIITDAEMYYTYTFTGDVNYFKVIPFRASYLKLEVKGTGTMTGSSCAVDIMGVY